jgi:hypothetical protein
MFRTVVGKIFRTSDTPWTNCRVIFRRAKGNYDSAKQYPPDSVIAFTDSQGNICRDALGTLPGVQLWVNESGELLTLYECLLPNSDKFQFSIPVGDGSPIELSVLREGSNPVTSYPQTLLDYIDTSVSLHNLNPNAHPLLSSGQIKIPFAWGDSTPKNIATVPANTTVFTSIISVTETFNGVGANLRLGDANNLTRFLDIPSQGLIADYELESNVTFTYTSSTQLLLSITPGTGASQGKGFVIIEI